VPLFHYSLSIFISLSVLPPSAILHRDSGTLSNSAFNQLNAELSFIEDNNEHGEIASGFTQIDTSLVDELIPDADIDNPSAAQAEAEASDPAVESSLQQFLSAAKRRIVKEIEKYGQPLCYKQGSFFEYAVHPVFAVKKAAAIGLTPNRLYHRDIFLWLPHLLPGHPDKFKCTCGMYLSKHGMQIFTPL